MNNPNVLTLIVLVVVVAGIVKISGLTWSEFKAALRNYANQSK